MVSDWDLVTWGEMKSIVDAYSARCHFPLSLIGPAIFPVFDGACHIPFPLIVEMASNLAMQHLLQQFSGTKATLQGKDG